VEPPYQVIVSSLEGCFDSTGKVYPGLRDRAYYSAQAVIWIRICAICVSEELVSRFPPPVINCDTRSLDMDLRELRTVYICQSIPRDFPQHPCSPTHLQWTSNMLLHQFRAMQNAVVKPESGFGYFVGACQNPAPLDAILNCLLAYCIFVDWPIYKNMLKIQDKLYVISFFSSASYSCHSVSNYFHQILSEFTKAMDKAIQTSHYQ